MAGNTDSVELKLEVLSHAEIKKLNKDKIIKKLLAAQSYGLSVQAQLDSMNEKLSSLSMKVDAMEVSSSEPSSLATNSRSQFIKLEKEMYATQQYSRRDTIEICGIPSSVDDKMLEKIDNGDIGNDWMQGHPSLPSITQERLYYRQILQP